MSSSRVADLRDPEKRQAARYKTAERIRSLEAEVAQLRAALTADEPMTLEMWETMPEDIRDRFTVQAIFQNSGNPGHALKQLGFSLPSRRGEDPALMRLLRERVLATPGVLALLRQDLRGAEINRESIMQRQVEISVRGTPDQSVRATQNVAKLAGWLKDAEPSSSQTVNIFAIAGNPDEARARARTIEHDDPDALPSHAAAALLSHLPGKPVRIDSGNETVDAILAQHPVEDVDDPAQSDTQDEEGVEEASDDPGSSGLEDAW